MGWLDPQSLLHRLTQPAGVRDAAAACGGPPAAGSEDGTDTGSTRPDSASPRRAFVDDLLRWQQAHVQHATPQADAQGR